MRDEIYDDLTNLIEASPGLCTLCAILYLTAWGWRPAIHVAARYSEPYRQESYVRWRHENIIGEFHIANAVDISRDIFEPLDGEQRHKVHRVLPYIS